jgi:hypothetical protein
MSRAINNTCEIDQDWLERAKSFKSEYPQLKVSEGRDWLAYITRETEKLAKNV